MGAAFSKQMNVDFSKLKPKEIAELMKVSGKQILLIIVLNNFKKVTKTKEIDFDQVLGKSNFALECLLKYIPTYGSDLDSAKFYKLNDSKKIKFLDTYEKTPVFQKFLDCMVKGMKNKKMIKMKDNIDNIFEKKIEGFRNILDACVLSKKEIKELAKRLKEGGYKKEATDMLLNIKELDKMMKNASKELKVISNFYKDNKKKIDELKKDPRKYIAFIFLRITNKIYKI